MNLFNITAFECPADGCEWRITTQELALREVAAGIRPRLKVTYRADGSPMFDASESVAEHAKFTDGVLREHLETHDVFDWVNTIVNRDQQLYQYEDTGIRPHVYTAVPINMAEADQQRRATVSSQIEKWMR